MRIKAPGGACWQAEAPTEKIVVAVDLYDSPRRRLEHADGALDPDQQIERYAESFLRHNAIIYEMYEQLDGKFDVRLVNFVADAALFTFGRSFNREAMKFALQMADTLGQSELETSIGIDIGLVATFNLRNAAGADTGFGQMVGMAVDRAVRLSWLARPGEVLVTSRVTAAPNLGDEFLFNPESSAVALTLDKWHPDSTGALRVRAVSLPGQVGRPLWGNTRELSRYVHEILEAMERLQESAPYLWSAVESVLNGTHHSTKWQASEHAVGLLETIAAPLRQPPPELALFPELAQAIDEFSEWCIETRGKALKLQALLRQGGGAWKSVDEGGCDERLKGHFTSVITASRTTLASLSGGQRVS